MKSIFLALALALGLLASPALSFAQPGSGGTRPLNVTHEHQGNTMWCNFYALAAITRFHNSQNPANQHSPVRGAGGLAATAAARGWHDGDTQTALSDDSFIRLANRLGYRTTEYTGTFRGATARADAMARMVSELRAGRPPGIGLQGHAWVVTGVETDARGNVTHVLLTHSGPPGATHQRMPIATFLPAWEAFDFNLIAVFPPNAPVARGAAAGAAAGAGWAGALGRN